MRSHRGVLCTSGTARAATLLLVLATLLIIGGGVSPTEAATITLVANLTNDQENPPANPTGRPASSGTAQFVLDDVAQTLTFTATISNIDFTGSQTADPNDNLTAAHIHAGPMVTPSTNGPVVWGFFGAPFNETNPNDQVVTPFASGVGGTISGKWDASEGNGTTLAAQMDNILNGRAYINFHTTQFGGGEVRGAITAIAPQQIEAVKAVTDVNGGQVEPGDILEYRITVTNAGQQGVGLDGLSDIIPGGTSYVGGSLAVISGANAGAKTDAAGDDQAEFQEFDPPPSRAFFRLGAGATATTGGTLAAGASTTVAFRVQVDAGAPDGAQIGNQASVFAGSLTVVSNAVTSVVSNQADLAVTKVIDNPNPSVGDTVTFTVTLTNNGPQDATGVRVTDQGTEIFPSATPSQGTYDPATGLWNVGDLANGATATLTLQITFTQAMIDAGSFTNRAEITDADQPDPNPTNNSDAVTTPPESADLEVAKTVDNATADVGDTITFTVTLTNNGPDAATNVSLADLLPAGLTFVGATPSQGSYAAATGVWTVGTVAASASTTLQIQAVVSETGSHTNTATVASVDQFDPNPANNSAQATVAPMPQPPVAVDDTATTPFNTPVTIVVDANDTGTGIEVTNVSIPANGSAVENSDGSITYTPTAGFSGQDSFTYTITDDNGQTDTATVTVTVQAGPPPTPLNAVDDTATTPFNTSVTIVVDANDTGAGIEVTSVSNPPNGSTVLNSDGTITYTPDTGFSGTDTFTYEITDDDGDTDTATVTVTVTGLPAPVAMNDSAITPFNTAVTVNVLANDTGTGIEVTNVTDPPNGTATLNSDGTITYTPDTGFSGPDSFIYTITDDLGQTDTATVTVTVLPDTAPPTVANDDTATTPFNTAVTINVLANDTGEGIEVTSVTDPLNGTAVLNTDDTITYTPDDGFSGPDPFTYQITDDDGETDAAMVTVTVIPGPMPQPPVAVSDVATTPFATAVTINVLANDSGTGIEVTDASDPPNGTAVINADDTITYVPDTGFSGTDTFTYTITDDDDETDTATVTINVIGLPAPVAMNDSATTPFNTAVTIDVLANDTGIGIEVITVGTPTNGTVTLNADGTITYTPAAGFSGLDSFTYTITDDDDETDTATVTVTVLPSPMGDIIVGTPTVNSQPAGSAPGPTVPAGGQITITISVQNTGDTAVTNLGGTSSLGTITCQETTLQPDQATTCSVNGTAAAGAQQVSITIVATAAGGETVTAAAVAFYTGMSAAPGDITVGTPAVNGQSAGSAPGPTVPVGEAITIALLVTNSGPVMVSNLMGTTGSGTLTCAAPALAAGASTICTVAGTAAAGPQQVSLTITALGANGQPVSATTTAFYTGVQAAPTITAINPNSGSTLGGTPVTISGSGFQPGATVRFGGTAASGASCTATGTQCIATTPPHAPGPVAVTVTNPDQQTATLAGGFTYIAPAPIVASVSPATGPEAGGTAVTISGENLTSPLGPTTVTFGGSPATSVHCPSPTHCQAVSPPGRGTVSVRVTVGGQTSADTAAATFVYEPPPQPMTVTGQAWRQIPPIVSENQIEGTVVPVVGAVVEALIGGAVCGQGVTDSQGRVQLVVAADPPARGCGRPGVVVSFRVNGAVVGETAAFRSGGQASVTLILPPPAPPPRR